MFFGPIEKTRWPPGLWLASRNFSTSPLNGIQWNLTGSKILTSSIKFVFRADPKNKMATRPLIGFRVFDFSSERNLMILDRNQDLNVFYQVWVFRADRKKQDGRSSFWLAEKFSISPLKPLNGIQRNLRGSKISTSFYQVCIIRTDREKKTRWPPWYDWLRHFWLLSNCSLYKMEFNETWQKASAHCTHVHDMWPFGPFVFFFAF